MIPMQSQLRHSLPNFKNKLPHTSTFSATPKVNQTHGRGIRNPPARCHLNKSMSGPTHRAPPADRPPLRAQATCARDVTRSRKTPTNQRPRVGPVRGVSRQ